jgi:hypothetical protein
MSAATDATEQLGVLKDKAEEVRMLVSPALLATEVRPTPRATDVHPTPRATEVRPRRRALPGLVDRRAAWYGMVEEAVLDLSSSLPEGTEDYDARKLLEFLFGLRRAIAADPKATDKRGEVELATMMISDILRRIVRRLEHSEFDDPRAAADYVFTTLRNVGVTDLSRLLGVTTKTVNAWKAGRPVTRNAERVVVVAQLLTHLRSSMTPVGLVMWFDAPRHQLDRATPLQLLDENAANASEMLMPLARGARGQLAS